MLYLVIYKTEKEYKYRVNKLRPTYESSQWELIDVQYYYEGYFISKEEYYKKIETKVPIRVKIRKKIFAKSDLIRENNYLKEQLSKERSKRRWW